jgi:hypothetical protein
MKTQRRARHDGERALAPDDERDQVRAARAVAKVDDLTGPGHALQPEDHVLDLPVQPRALPGAPRRDPATDGAAEDGRGEVPEREAAAIEILLEGQAHLSGLDVERPCALVELAPARHPLQVEDDHALVREDPGADAAARAERDDRRLGVVRPADDARYLLGARRPDDAGRPVLAHVPRANGEVMSGPQVAGVGHAVGRIVARADAGHGAGEVSQVSHVRRLYRGTRASRGCVCLRFACCPRYFPLHGHATSRHRVFFSW